MSEIKTGGLDQYGAERFEQQQFEAAGVEMVKTLCCKCDTVFIVDLVMLVGVFDSAAVVTVD